MEKVDLLKTVGNEASARPDNCDSEKDPKAIARAGPNESRSRRNSWLPFPPGPMSTGFPGRQHFKVSQVAVSQSPSPPRNRTYEIQVKKLFYKLPPRRRNRFCLTKVLLKQNDQLSERFILRNINFDAKPGELLAIAGPSGAGKSTLLEVLAGRVKPTSPSGCVLINNQVMKMAHFQRVSGYVMQDDALFPHLTVFETLLFSAKLRLPAAMPVAEKKSRVQTLLEELGLLHVANTRIGNEMVRGVSGGERRRVSIGVDVIHDPAVLILDEPTSGLDSAAAMNIVAMLRNMAESHSRTVILSIHQPSFRILQQVHSILLLAEGMVVHHGSLELLASRLEVAGHEIPHQVNVLEYAIDAVNSWEADPFSDAPSKLKRLSLQDFLQHSQQLYVTDYDVDVEKGQKSPEDLETVVSSGDQDCIECVGEMERDEVTYANTAVQEIFVLAHRFYKNISRTNELFRLRSIQALIAGIALGTVFLHVGNSQKGIQERLGFLAFTLTFFLSSTTEALPIFLQERQILMQETSRGAYRISSYIISNALIFAPFLLVMALLYGIPAYWLVGLNSSYKLFLFFCLVMWLVLLMANSFVAFFSAMVPDYIIGNSLIAAWMGAFFLFSGYFISKDRIPKYWLWMHYMSLFKYPFDSLIVNEYENRLDMCYGPKDSKGVCSLTGAELIRQAGVTSRQKWADVAVMFFYVIFYRVLCYLVVRYRLSRRRR